MTPYFHSHLKLCSIRLHDVIDFEIGLKAVRKLLRIDDYDSKELCLIMSEKYQP